tara:strand:- start:284 stop:1552 length:1269 start_codon:yes stop_codon:yes gene_type:complete
MGGPIKEGVMHGIREPRNMGGRAALVGNPVFPKDASGRAHHNIWASIYGVGSKVLPKAGGIMSRAWNKIKPTAIPRVIKQPSSLPVGMRGTMGSRTTTLPFMERAGQFVRKNPWWTAGGAIYGGPAAGELGYKAATGPGWSLVKQAADLAVPDWIWDQDKWEAERAARKKELEKNLEIKPKKSPWTPGGSTTKPIISKSQRDKMTKDARDKRINNLLELMGYDKARKTAVGDALVDASQIVMERGTLDKKNIGRDLINPIIAATSKRLDKPEQIREAAGLLAAKGEIEKEIASSKGSANYQFAQDLVKTGAAPNIQAAMRMVAKQPGSIGEALVVGLSARGKGTLGTSDTTYTDLFSYLQKQGREGELKEVFTEEQIKDVGGIGKNKTFATAADVVKDKPNGLYIVEEKVIEVKDGSARRVG